MKSWSKLRARSWGLWCALFLSAGCHSPGFRENILSSIQSGVGVSVAPNPQTQVPEFKAGFIRSQLYSIPTGKKVRGKYDQDDDGFATHAEASPQLVSGIRAKSSWEQLFIGFEVSESFAVGEQAVQSEAATAMYIADARSEGRAKEAANAVSPEAREFARIRAQKIQGDSEVVLSKLFPAGDQVDPAALKKAVQGTPLADNENTLKKLEGLPKAEFQKRLLSRYRDLVPTFRKNLEP